VFPVPPALGAPGSLLEPPPPEPPGAPVFSNLPLPPPVEVIVLKTEFDPFPQSGPPPPTVIGYDTIETGIVPAPHEGNDVLKPPAPPPPA
jgi:hypothetical protein